MKISQEDIAKMNQLRALCNYPAEMRDETHLHQLANLVRELRSVWEKVIPVEEIEMLEQMLAALERMNAENVMRPAKRLDT